MLSTGNGLTVPTCRRHGDRHFAKLGETYFFFLPFLLFFFFAIENLLSTVRRRCRRSNSHGVYVNFSLTYRSMFC
jgi:hypothetical protein